MIIRHSLSFFGVFEFTGIFFTDIFFAVQVSKNLWISLLQRFHHDSIFPDKLVADFAETIWNRLTTERILSDDTLRMAIQTFMTFPAAETVTKFLEFLRTALLKKEFMDVSLSDVLIFRTSAGVLQDKSVLES